jgi:hypothetical protein
LLYVGPHLCCRSLFVENMCTSSDYIYKIFCSFICVFIYIYY